VRCFTVFVTISQNLDLGGSHAVWYKTLHAVGSPKRRAVPLFYHTLFLSTILVVNELWSTTGEFFGGDRDGDASVRFLLPSTVY